MPLRVDTLARAWAQGHKHVVSPSEFNHKACAPDTHIGATTLTCRPQGCHTPAALPHSLQFRHGVLELMVDQAPASQPCISWFMRHMSGGAAVSAHSPIHPVSTHSALLVHILHFAIVSGLILSLVLHAHHDAECAVLVYAVINHDYSSVYACAVTLFEGPAYFAAGMG